MVTQFSLYNESEMKQWDKFVESHPNGSPYHLSCWLQTIYKTYSFKPLLYVFKTENNTISAVFPCFLIKNSMMRARIVSLPFSDYCGPLCTGEGREIELISQIMESNKDKNIEIRCSVADGCGLTCHNYYKRHILELVSDPEELKTKIDKRTIQYSIRKAKKNGVEVRPENNERGLEEFYRLNMVTRKKHGVPSQPRRFFANLLEHMVAAGHAEILISYYDSKAVASSVFFKFKDTVHYKYNATDPAYVSKVTPNHLLTWHAIEKACLDGYRFLDFGRTSPENEGLMRYKAMWGGEPSDLPYFYHPAPKGAASQKESGLSYRIMTSTWRRLPDSLIELLGPMIYKRMA
jgi:lipid II:glycine glycyltransferase (peptidoglycan interpeptide bridge formation enzyme)